MREREAAMKYLFGEVEIRSETGYMLAKGDYVMVYGSIRTRNETDENGVRKTRQQVICKDILKVNHLEGF